MCPTKEIIGQNILTFEEALKTTSESLPYDKKHWLYIPSFYSNYRYVLGTIGENPLITIGINPSTAAPENLDNTLQSVKRIASYNRYDSFIMFNVYTQRATNPNDMDQIFNQKLHTENMKAFRFVLERANGKPAIWAAWGTIIQKRVYLIECLKDMVQIGTEYNAQWYRAGFLTKQGHPHHPLYLRKDSELICFDVEEYLKNLKID